MFCLLVARSLALVCSSFTCFQACLVGSEEGVELSLTRVLAAGASSPFIVSNKRFLFSDLFEHRPFKE